MSDTSIPEGYTSLTPFLCVDGAAAAIDFYVSVFGAKLVDRMDGQDGTVAHAELDFGSGRLQLGDPAEAYQIAAPDRAAPATHSIGVLLRGRRRRRRQGRAGRRGDPRTRADLRHRRSVRVDPRPVRHPVDGDDPRRGASPPRSATAGWPSGPQREERLSDAALTWRHVLCVLRHRRRRGSGHPDL